MRRSRLGLWYALLAASIPPGAAFAGDVVRVAATDMETIRTRLRARLLEKARVDAGSVRKLTERQKRDGSWPDVDYADRSRSNFVPVRHLHRLRTMALAHALPNSARVSSGERGDVKLKGAIKRGLDLWARRRPRSGNWWHNHIGCPRAMADVLLLVADDIPPETFEAAMETVRKSYKTGWIINTGQNLVWKAGVAMVQGCLEKDEKVLRWAVDSIRRTIAVTGKEGIQADFSFHQHGPQLYSGGYGASFVVDCSAFALLVRGTGFGLTEEQTDALSGLILDGHQWMVREGVFDYGALGRGISRRGEVRRNGKAGALRRAAENMAKIKTPREAEFRGLLARLRGEKHAKLLIGNRHFWRSDFMVHHRKGWYASVKMASKRVTATESGNGEGLRNWYMGAGVNFVIRRGDEYEDVFPVWDWRKLPGTTVEESDAKLPECSWGRGARGKTSFVGGVSDGVYGLAAYDYAKDGIRARKAWFFFDDEFVCLGAGIAATGNGMVCTTLNQCRLRGDVYRDDGTGTSRLGGGRSMFGNPRFVHHDGIGYVFLGEGDVRADLVPRTGSWHDINRNQSKGKVKLDVFGLWIDHGVRPEKASYAYAVVPGTDVRKLGAYIHRPPVTVVKNARGLQAVRHERLKVTGLAFYEAGEIEAAPGLTVSVDRPCLVLVRAGQNGLRLSVSNPDNEPATVHVDVGRRLSGEGTRWLGDRNVTRVTFDLPGGLQAGRSVLRDLRYSR